jgi:hypothetical protein
MSSNTTVFVIPQIPEPSFGDPELYFFATAVKDAINQLNTSINTLSSKVSWL